VIWTEEELSFVRERARTWDIYYSESLWGSGLYQILEPLLDSFNDDGGVPKQIGTHTESLPETTATVLLSLSRMRLIGYPMRNKIHEYLWSTHSLVKAGLESAEDAEGTLHCWSDHSRNVWTTTLCLWALMGTAYDGKYSPLMSPSIGWLIEQQRPEGGWGFDKLENNPSSVFLTAACIYTLHLSQYLRPEREGVELPGRVSSAVARGMKWLQERQDPRTGLWTDEHGNGEPTASSMALWALRLSHEESARRSLKRGLESLLRELRKTRCGKSMDIANGTLPDSREPIALQGYTPAIPLALLQLGVDPHSPVVMGPLQFLRSSRQSTGWDFPVIGESGNARYLKSVPYVGTGEPLTFTTALALQTGHAWHRRLTRTAVEREIDGSTSRRRWTRV
jgi:hypothetical protein